MSLREVSAPRPLLAKKGGAAPAKPGSANSGIERGGPVEPSLRPIESDVEISLESAPADATAGLDARAIEKRSVDTAPAASLLPFNLLRKKYRPGAMSGLSEEEPDIAPEDFVVPPEAESKPKQQAELALLAKPAPESKLEPAPELKIPHPSEVGPDPRLDTPSPAPSPNPEWRVGVEAADQPNRVSANRVSSGGWLLRFGALAAAIAMLVVGWKIANPDTDLALRDLGFGDLSFGSTPEPVAAGDSVDSIATPTAVEPPPPIEEALALPVSPDPVEPETPAPYQTSLPEPILELPVASAPDVAGTPIDGTPSDSAIAELPLADAPTVPASENEPVPAQTDPTAAVPAPVKPTVDVVRLEANGDAVIAGRAAPNSELIVLDNGEPIGTVQVDAFGEWVFVPEAALPIGDHEFGLVVKTVQDSISLPAPENPPLPPAPELESTIAEPGPAFREPEMPPAVPSRAAPDTEANVTLDDLPAANANGTVDQSVPLPVHKPEPPNAGAAPANDPAEQQESSVTITSDFIVQLASVKTRAGAEQEWRKLKQRFPEILSDMVPVLDEVKLIDYGTVVRVRTGAFDSQRDAANLCAQLAAKRQACLVVKISGSN